MLNQVDKCSSIITLYIKINFKINYAKIHVLLIFYWSIKGFLRQKCFFLKGYFLKGLALYDPTNNSRDIIFEIYIVNFVNC